MKEIESNVVVRHVRPEDRAGWARCRRKLWPMESPSEILVGVDEFLAGRGLYRVSGIPVPAAVFVAVARARTVVGFVEIMLRPVVDGSIEGPSGYLEGWYVAPIHRRTGVGSRLVRAAEDWAAQHGCREMGSDVILGNTVSELAHRSLGYEVVDRATRFRRTLEPPPQSYLVGGVMAR